MFVKKSCGGKASDQNGKYFEQLNVYLIFDQPSYSYVKEEVLYFCIHNRRVSVTLWFENKHKLSQKLASPSHRLIE